MKPIYLILLLFAWTVPVFALDYTVGEVRMAQPGVDFYIDHEGRPITGTVKKFEGRKVVFSMVVENGIPTLEGVGALTPVGG